MNADRYPKMSEYHGGGSILNGYTTFENIIKECRRERVSPNLVFHLLIQGHELIILNGEIKAISEETKKP